MRGVRGLTVVALLALVSACGNRGVDEGLPTTSVATTTTTSSVPTTTIPPTTVTTTTTTVPPPTTSTTVPSTTTPSATVGSKLTLDNHSTVRLLAYGPGTPSAYYAEEAKPGTSLVEATVEGCVPAKGEVTSFNPLYFSLKLPDNTKVSVELGAVDGQIDSNDVLADDCVRGKVGFVIPSGTKPSYLYFEPLTGSPLRWKLPALASSPTTTAPASPTTGSALSVVKEYFAAINARDFRRAWDLGGKNIQGGDYASFVEGFSGTRTDTLASTSTEGNTVHVTLVATQTSGQRQIYQGTYTVSHGVIVSANIVRTG